VRRQVRHAIIIVCRVAPENKADILPADAHLQAQNHSHPGQLYFAGGQRCDLQGKAHPLLLPAFVVAAADQHGQLALGSQLHLHRPPLPVGIGQVVDRLNLDVRLVRKPCFRQVQRRRKQVAPIEHVVIDDKRLAESTLAAADLAAEGQDAAVAALPHRERDRLFERHLPAVTELQSGDRGAAGLKRTDNKTEDRCARRIFVGRS